MSFIPKIFFIDLDGTLLDKGFFHNTRISTKNLEMVKLVNKEIPVVISTGRNFDKKVQKIVKDLEIDYVVCQNGSLIINKNFQIIKNLAINEEIVQEIKNIIIEHKMCYSINSIGKIYGKKIKSWLISKFSHFEPTHFDSDFNIENKVNKILIIDFSKKSIKKIYKILSEKFENKCSMHIVGKGYAIEITDFNATKGKTNAYVAKYLYKVDPKKTVHIGDSMNDSTTIKYMGEVVAMKNANKKLKKIAHKVSYSKRKAGVGRILNDYLEENN